MSLEENSATKHHDPARLAGRDPSVSAVGHDRMARRAALSGFLGSVIEYYDFLIYGTAAALVFGRLFFPTGSAAAGTLAALATFGVAYIARPAGAVLFGHFGDRIGRKNVLMATLSVMGGASALIGLLPTYASIGYAAPALLVVCRLAQGLSAGGEQTGASLLAMEHATPKKRAFYSSWTPNGATIGSALATAVFIPIASLPEDALMSWGWRIPFLVSLVTVPIALYLRRGVAESPQFTRRDNGTTPKKTSAPKAPLLAVFKDEPRALVCVFFCSLIQSVATFVTVFSLSFAVHNGAVGRTPILTAISVSQLFGLVFIPIWAALSVRVGGKRMFAAGALLSAAGAVGFLMSVANGNAVLAMVMIILVKGVFYPASNGIWPVFFGRQFTARVRYTGMGVAMQSGLVVVGFVPVLCTALVGNSTDGWVPVAVLIVGICLVAAVAGGLSRDAKDWAPEENRPE
ncbi:MFS transporter [Rhodococcus sp. T2V]|uniref:MFS transporter n=1 Tax=Rhodococcus sp. T2V TaxID=3034164 RepID=UPI0023E30543|nr:MFS transporter [Rhodococcus sp. T2V]MDF3311476.1 MFS transporter [Rhodococcus sp. T2V]